MLLLFLKMAVEQRICRAHEMGMERERERKRILYFKKLFLVFSNVCKDITLCRSIFVHQLSERETLDRTGKVISIDVVEKLTKGLSIRTIKSKNKNFVPSIKYLKLKDIDSESTSSCIAMLQKKIEQDLYTAGYVGQYSLIGPILNVLKER